MTAVFANMLRQSWAGLRVLLAFTIVLGLGYPLVVAGISQLLLNDQANGSLVERDGRGRRVVADRADLRRAAVVPLPAVGGW